MDMQTPQFGATVQDGKNLTRVEKPFGVKGTFEPLLMFKIVFAKDLAHEIALFHADAMFAGQDAAHLYA